MKYLSRLWLTAVIFLSILIGNSALAEVELTLRYNFDNIDEIRAGLDQFEKDNPGIKVELERITFKDARDQFIREAATGVGPDVVHLAFVWIKDLGIAEACMKINDLIDKHGIGENGFDDFIATDLVFGDDEESIYGIPFATDTWAMIYNKEIMKEAGIDKIPETWDELLDASRKAKAAGKIGFGFAAVPDDADADGGLPHRDRRERAAIGMTAA